MSDFEVITITLHREPAWKSKIEIDGKPVTNVYAIRLEQKSPIDPVTVELSIYGTELAVSPTTVADVFLHPTCPYCKQGWGVSRIPSGTSQPVDRRAETS